MVIKGAYLTSYNLKNKADGVSKKINYQIQSMTNKGLNVDVLDLNSMKCSGIDNIVQFLYRVLGLSYESSKLLIDISKENNKIKDYSFIYIRKDFCNRSQIAALKKIKKNNPRIKILIEYPTYPYDKEICGRRRILALPIDQWFRRKLKYVVDRAVTFSDDRNLFGVPCINISNAIDYSKVSLRSPKEHDSINLIAVALFGYFHGYDRLLEAMGRNKEFVEQHNIHFHMVGNGRAVSEYMRIIKKYSIEPYVHLYGKLCGSELDQVYNIADIAVDNMGRHRVGCFYNSSLKGKEYGAKGLPMISGVETDLDKYNLDFYFRVPADDSIIDLQDIVRFYHKMYDGRNEKDVATEVRKKTKQYFSFDIAFQPIIDFIEG